MLNKKITRRKYIFVLDRLDSILFIRYEVNTNISIFGWFMYYIKIEFQMKKDKKNQFVESHKNIFIIYIVERKLFSIKKNYSKKRLFNQS